MQVEHAVELRHCLGHMVGQLGQGFGGANNHVCNILPRSAAKSGSPARNKPAGYMLIPRLGFVKPGCLRNSSKSASVKVRLCLAIL
jgi:hypothetical protein